jgi:glycosyltransferase involved in cell wall biosynthesis
VTLFAAGGSNTAAKLIPGCDRSLRLKGIHDHTASNLVMLDKVKRHADEFDIIHCHIDVLQYPLFQDLSHKLVTTLHGRLDLPDTWPIYEAFPHMPLISISNKQREPLPAGLNWLATVYHGSPEKVCPFNEKGGDYLAFLGRLSAEKRPDRAIEIAKKAGVPLKIAAKIADVDLAYFKAVVEPMLDHPLIEFIGEIDEDEKCSFIGNALALLFPIDWVEPFGLVMIEAMSAGTPVIAWREGSVPEIIQDGVSGIIVDSIDMAVDAVERVRSMDRRKVRRYFESRFTDKHMTRNYVDAYEKLLGVTRSRRPIESRKAIDGLRRRKDPRLDGAALFMTPDDDENRS